MKLKCECGKLATWYYMPDKNEWACCDACVPRGCSCNELDVNRIIDGEVYESLPNEEWLEGKDWEWVIKDKRWRDLDGEGRQIPCCEWAYDEKGWDKNE